MNYSSRCDVPYCKHANLKMKSDGNLFLIALVALLTA